MSRLLLVGLVLIFVPTVALPVPDLHDYSQYTHWENSFLTSNDEVTSAVRCEILGTSYLATTGLTSGLTFFGITAGGVEELGNLPLPGSAQDVAFDGGFAYVVSQPDRLNKIVAFTPSSLASIWVENLPGSPEDVEMFGQYLLIACGADGLLVFDPTDDFNIPVGVVGSWPGTAREVQVTGTTAVVRTDAGITILDLNDPLIPLEMGSYDLTGSLSLTIQDTWAYLGRTSTPDTGGRVAEQDFSDPWNPILAKA